MKKPTMDNKEPPSDLDIFCGRGKGRWASPGNQRFREIIKSSVQMYSKAPSKAGKTRVVEKVVAIIKEGGIRFVKGGKQLDQWVELDSKEERHKVAHAIRDLIAASSSNLASKKDGIRTPVKRGGGRNKRKSLNSSVAGSVDHHSESSSHLSPEDDDVVVGTFGSSTGSTSFTQSYIPIAAETMTQQQQQQQREQFTIHGSTAGNMWSPPDSSTSMMMPDAVLHSSSNFASFAAAAPILPNNLSSEDATNDAAPSKNLHHSYDKNDDTANTRATNRQFIQHEMNLSDRRLQSPASLMMDPLSGTHFWQPQTMIANSAVDPSFPCSPLQEGPAAVLQHSSGTSNFYPALPPDHSVYAMTYPDMNEMNPIMHTTTQDSSRAQNHSYGFNNANYGRIRSASDHSNLHQHGSSQASPPLQAVSSSATLSSAFSPPRSFQQESLQHPARRYEHAATIDNRNASSVMQQRRPMSLDHATSDNFVMGSFHLVPDSSVSSPQPEMAPSRLKELSDRHATSWMQHHDLRQQELMQQQARMQQSPLFEHDELMRRHVMNGEGANLEEGRSSRHYSYDRREHLTFRPQHMHEARITATAPCAKKKNGKSAPKEMPLESPQRSSKGYLDISSPINPSSIFPPPP